MSKPVKYRPCRSDADTQCIGMESVFLHGARRKNAAINTDGEENAGHCETLPAVRVLNLFWIN